jgi:5-methylcytosine-specific restriction enzyme subunit McrC
LDNPLPRLTLKEYEPGFIEGVALSKGDLQLAESLDGEDGRLIVEDLKKGIRVTATSWVGVVRFSSFEVRVVPKLAGENLGLVGMLAFTTGMDSLNRNKGLRDLDTLAHADLFDLLALLFAEACERIVNGGLLYDYIVEEQDLPVLRGRMLVREQVQRRKGQVDRIECRYDEHSSNIPENKVLTIALNFCAKRVKHPAVLRKVRRLMQIFLETCSIQDANIEDLFNRVTYHRQNQHYEEPIELAKILLHAAGVNNLFSSGMTKSFAFLLDMNKLFELFVYRFTERALVTTGCHVQYQHKDRSIIWNADANRPYAGVIPDLIVEYTDLPSKRMVIDTKYKLYDLKKISPSDIYQCFLYAYAYSSNTGNIPKSVILYPTLETSPASTNLHVRTKALLIGAKVSAQGFNIPIALEEIRRNIKGTMTALVASQISTG